MSEGRGIVRTRTCGPSRIAAPIPEAKKDATQSGALSSKLRMWARSEAEADGRRTWNEEKMDVLELRRAF